MSRTTDSVPPMMRWTGLLFVVMLALAGCGGGGGGKKVVAQGPASVPTKGAAPWPAPSNPLALARKAGLTPETREFVFLHVHSHLDVFVNGNPVIVPAAIGIDIHDPAVKRIPLQGGTIAYGGINPPCAQPCISPLHTHDPTGILHTEAKKNQFNTLGEFFTEWNVRLDPKCVGGYCKPAAPFTVYVDGDPYTGDPRKIELEDRKEIAIVIGTPPASIPSRF
jgi:hypothetical protein